MKKLMGILLAASMVFSLAACGSTANTAASSAAGTTATAEAAARTQRPMSRSALSFWATRPRLQRRAHQRHQGGRCRAGHER